MAVTRILVQMWLEGGSSIRCKVNAYEDTKNIHEGLSTSSSLNYISIRKTKVLRNIFDHQCIECETKIPMKERNTRHDLYWLKPNIHA